MRRLMTHVTRTVAVLAIAGAPTLALAQTPQASQTKTNAAQPNPAAEHLAAARASLNKVLNAPAPSGDAYKKLADIKTHYIALEKAASTAAPEWKTHYAEIDRLAGELLAAPPAAADKPVGTSGRTDAPAATGLDPAIATNLLEFRTHLTAFSAAMSPPSAAAATPASAATATPPAASTSATTSAAPPAASAPSPSAAPEAANVNVTAQVDQAIALVDATLNANAQATSISVDRATLEQLKVQLEQIKQGVKKQ